MLDALEDLPFAAQRAWLDQRLEAGDDPGALLAAVAPLPDHGPLGHLLGRLVERGALGGEGLGEALGALVAAGAETAVQAALRALPPGRCPGGLVERVARAVAALPLGRVAVAALALRWLREADPARHRGLREEAVARCERAAALGLDPPDSALLLAPGAALAALPGGPRGVVAAARERMAPRLLAAIGAAPRSLAQVNAEELLARRVYEGSGHFLFELLQNADDAGASGVELAIEPGELRLGHDGAPFDPLDVLGVLSIGLSTKGAGSIGLFGVGFRSVYAVTERPQIHSGPFRFEISGMARPRPLAPRPGLDGGETLLVLPLDRPGVTADALAAEASALPAEVLLTLRHLRRLALALPGAPGRDLVLVPGGGGAAGPGEAAGGEEARLEDRRTGASVRYRLAREGEALVAWRLDDAGRPAARPAGAPSLHCFLPMREDTGLPVLIHAPFAVPVDRERLHHDDPRNRRLLGDAAAALGALVASLSGPALGAALALLAASRPPPAFAGVLEDARRRLAAAPLLTAAGGQPLAASQARLVPPALAAALAGVPLDADGRLALAPPPATDARAARWLGAVDLAPLDLVALLERALGGRGEGEPSPAPWLSSPLALAGTLGSLDEAGARRRDALAWVVVDGACWRAASVRLAGEAERRLYDGARPLLDAGAASGSELAAAGLRRLSDRELVADLRDPAMRASLLRDGDALLGHLGGLPPALLDGLGALPLFATTDGRLAPVAGPGAAFASVEPELTGLRLLAWGPPRVVDDVAARHAPLLAALGGRALGWEALLGAWRALAAPDGTVPPPDDEIGRAVDEALQAAERAWRGWAPARLEGLLAAPLFADTAGRRRPLRGGGAALAPADEAVAELVPWAPWLARPHRALTLLEGGAVRRVGAAALVEAMLGEGPLAALRDDPRWPDLDALAAYLGPRSGPLPPSLTERLARAPVWADAAGEFGPLERLRRPADDEAVERLWALTSGRPRARRDALRLAAALGLDGRLGRASLADLLDDALAGRLDLTAHRADLAAALRGQPALLAAPSTRASLAALPLWRASDGARRPARALVPAPALAALLDDPDAPALLGDPAGLLHPDEQPEADALADLFAFRPALERLDEAVQREARPGRPLDEQPPWMASLARLWRLGAVARGHGRSDWPVALTAAGLVVAQPPWLADEAEQELAAATPLRARLADAAWASGQTALALPSLPTWRLLDALAPALRERGDASASPLTPARREALHGWLLRHAVEIEDDPQARGRLGKLHAFAAADGSLRSPAELLLAPGFDDLDLPGRPAPELPSPLRSWLARLFRLDEASVGPLVAALIEGSTAAADAGDHARLARTLAALAAVIEGGDQERVERALRAEKAARRLRLPASEGPARRARDLLDETDERYALVRAFHRSPPPRPAIDDTLRPLLARLGAPVSLPSDELRAHLAPDGRRPGLESTLALATYVALAATATPALRDALDLDRAAWVPAADGSLHRPAALYWPSDGLADLIGPRSDRVAHARLAAAAPPTLARWLRFRTLADVTAAEVARALLDRSNDPALATRWLDDALREGRAPNLRSLGLHPGHLADPERYPRLVRELTPPPAAERPPAAPAPRSTTAAAPAPDARSTPARSAPPGARSTPAEPPAPPPRRSLWSRLFGPSEPAPPPAAPPGPPPAAPPLADAPPPAPAGATGPDRHERRAREAGAAPGPGAPRAARAPGRPGVHHTSGDSIHDDLAAAAGDEPPARLASSEEWFRPRGALDPQLGRTSGWLASRQQRARHGFALSPPSLPQPHLYAPAMVVGRFDPATQRWHGGDLAPDAARSHAGTVGAVTFEGRLAAGEVILPCPLFAAVTGATLDGAPLALTRTADGLTTATLPHGGAVRFTASLHAPPRLLDGAAAPPAPPSLLASTVPDRELPGELHAFLAELAAARLPPLARAQRVRDLVRTRYRYDLSYLQDDRVARRLAAATAGSAHRHLAALHAGRDGEHLGAGVCYELNALVCELLRRSGVPAALSTGWVLDRGQIDEPDHLWALALLASDQGPRWMPLDASLGRDGRPQVVPRRPPGDFRVSAPAPGEPPPVSELVRAARYLARQQGAGEPDEEALRQQVRRLLDDPEQARRLWALLRGRP